MKENGGKRFAPDGAADRRENAAPETAARSIKKTLCRLIKEEA